MTKKTYLDNYQPGIIKIILNVLFWIYYDIYIKTVHAQLFSNLIIERLIFIRYNGQHNNHPT